MPYHSRSASIRVDKFLHRSSSQDEVEGTSTDPDRLNRTGRILVHHHRLQHQKMPPDTARRCSTVTANRSAENDVTAVACPSLCYESVCRVHDYNTPKEVE